MAQTKQQGRQRREVGYILLEECHIVITNRGATEVFGLGGGGAGSPQPNFRLGAWYDVDLFSEPPPVLAENDNIPSDGCDLVLYPRFYQDQYASTSDSPVENHVTSFATATSILPFHGLIFETIAKKNFPSNDLFPQDATTATSKQNKSAKKFESGRGNQNTIGCIPTCRFGTGGKSSRISIRTRAFFVEVTTK
mmetsp:Transcript_28916/g.58324  ORF Transcript_28916/g.58324 Transcript_28916/m.58324 type:complete len:194 (-) Transcript_28916:553-1134(-)